MNNKKRLTKVLVYVLTLIVTIVFSGCTDKKPKEGMEFVVVTIHEKNVGDKNISYNPYNFKIQNSKGQITDGTITGINRYTVFSSGDLAPGGEVEGTMVYEQP